MFGLTGCTFLLPDHHAKWTGVREGRMMYEVSCDKINDCFHDTNRMCQGRPWKVSLQWEGLSDHHFMVECYK